MPGDVLTALMMKCIQEGRGLLQVQGDILHVPAYAQLSICMHFTSHTGNLTILLAVLCQVTGVGKLLNIT